MSAPGSTPDPLIAERNAVAEKLNRRRLTASDASKEIAQNRNSFFERLALLIAGALTFSVTLIGHLGEQSVHAVLFLHVAWGFLLLALLACLARNLSHQHFVFSDVAVDRAEAEIAFIDVGTRIVSTKTLAYSDSSEAFDKERELLIYKNNRQVWQKEQDERRRQSGRYWRLVRVMEWAACLCMFFGFLLLVTFAVANS